MLVPAWRGCGVLGVPGPGGVLVLPGPGGVLDLPGPGGVLGVPEQVWRSSGDSGVSCCLCMCLVTDAGTKSSVAAPHTHFNPSLNPSVPFMVWVEIPAVQSCAGLWMHL